MRAATSRNRHEALAVCTHQTTHKLHPPTPNSHQALEAELWEQQPGAMKEAQAAAEAASGIKRAAPEVRGFLCNRSCLATAHALRRSSGLSKCVPPSVALPCIQAHNSVQVLSVGMAAPHSRGSKHSSMPVNLWLPTVQPRQPLLPCPFSLPMLQVTGDLTLLGPASEPDSRKRQRLKAMARKLPEVLQALAAQRAAADASAGAGSDGGVAGAAAGPKEGKNLREVVADAVRSMPEAGDQLVEDAGQCAPAAADPRL